jgi:hypothetical protein
MSEERLRRDERIDPPGACLLARSLRSLTGAPPPEHERLSKIQ